MMLKKTRQEVLDQINNNAYDAVSSTLHNGVGNQLRLDTGSFVHTLQMAIADAVTAGFKTLLENQYTDDDFERDLTLKK